MPAPDCLLWFDWLNANNIGTLADIATIVGVVGLVWAGLSFHYARNAFYQQVLVSCVKDADDATGTALLSYYQSQLAGTYIAYSGTGTFNTISDYVRIDGPNVWIELVVQRGAENPAIVHFHTIYRDRARDYGGNFYGSYTTALGAKTAVASQQFSVFPNPTAGGNALQVKLAKPATTASYTVRNSLGQTIATKAFTGSAVQVPTEGLASGTYILSLEADGQEPVTHRFVVD